MLKCSVVICGVVLCIYTIVQGDTITLKSADKKPSTPVFYQTAAEYRNAEDGKC